MPNEPGKALTFKALQTYTGGEVVRWIGPPDAEEPAPQVTLTAARKRRPPAGRRRRRRGRARGLDGGEADDGEDDDDGPSTGLVIVALILGALGLAAGIAGLMTARRARTG